MLSRRCSIGSVCHQRGEHFMNIKDSDNKAHDPGVPPAAMTDDELNTVVGGGRGAGEFFKLASKGIAKLIDLIIKKATSP
jgi:hypothetical protein